MKCIEYIRDLQLNGLDIQKASEKALLKFTEDEVKRAKTVLFNAQKYTRK